MILPRLSALAACLTFAACSGADGDLPRSYRALRVPEARLKDAAAQKRGRTLFLTHCALCHGEGADGRGVRAEGLQRPPVNFRDAAWRSRTSPRRAFFAIREGVRGTPMPSWKSLEEDEAWDLVAFVLSAGEPHPGGSP
jgi:mono/diheme cytochrome c family protein